MVDKITYTGTAEIFASENRGGINYPHVLIGASNGPLFDAFGRLRVSNPVTIFDSKLIGLDKSPLFWDEALESGGGISTSTPSAAKPYMDFTSTDATAGVFTRQTFRRFNYQPGKSQLVAMTGVLTLSGGGTGVERRMGYFDDDSGAFFEDNAGTIGVTVRSNDTGTPINTTIVQADWNMDKMDGTAATINPNNNPSGITADFTKAQIFIIDFQWLSVGRVRFGLEIGGTIVYIHEFISGNLQAIPWASTPNLPLRYQMITTSSSPVSTMRVICSVVISEGGEDARGLTHSHATTVHINANTADLVYALVGVRLKSTLVGCNFELVSMAAIVESANKDIEWQLIHNPTVAGTFAYGDKTNSCTQVATGNTDSPSTNTITGGTIITRGFGVGSDEVTLFLKSSLSLGVAINGDLDTLVLAVRPLATNIQVQGALTWREII